MSADKLVFDLSQEIEGSPQVFIKKDWLSILDNMNTQYSSNQTIIDTSQLSNSNKYMSYREAYLAVPLIMTLSTSTAFVAPTNAAPATAGFSAATAAAAPPPSVSALLFLLGRVAPSTNARVQQCPSTQHKPQQRPCACAEKAGS
jgi:hypothetical protein